MQKLIRADEKEIHNLIYIKVPLADLQTNN
jgi:hypothetical protein